MEQLTPSRLDLLENSRCPIDENSPGKLICSSRWYYAAVMSNTDAALLSVGDVVTLDFSESLSVEATVEQRSEAEDDTCALVFSAAEQTLPFLQLRLTEATLLLAEFDGFLVPETAVFKNAHGQATLYTVIGGIVELVEVEILNTETKEGTCFVSPLEDGILYDGSPIVIQHDDVFDGMVLS